MSGGFGRRPSGLVYESSALLKIAPPTPQRAERMIPSKRVKLRECIEKGVPMPPEVEEGNVEYKVLLL